MSKSSVSISSLVAKFAQTRQLSESWLFFHTYEWRIEFLYLTVRRGFHRWTCTSLDTAAQKTCFFNYGPSYVWSGWCLLNMEQAPSAILHLSSPSTLIFKCYNRTWSHHKLAPNGKSNKSMNPNHAWPSMALTLNLLRMIPACCLDSTSNLQQEGKKIILDALLNGFITTTMLTFILTTTSAAH